jgi:antitoxin component of MazEF toxin-antitoxin module
MNNRCEKMPLIRKVLPIGNSRGITLPSDWLKFIERETGKKITEVLLEVDGNVTVSPVLEKKEAPTT